MNEPLAIVEVRVLGSLIEKQLTTPEYYPLTLNSLTTACNQKNNRDPVTAFDETTVVRALDLLREKKLVSTVTGAGIRVQKYKHNFDEVFSVNRQEISIMCLLMLRGPQTMGELKGRSGPMFQFTSVEEAEGVVSGLLQRDHQPLVQKLPRMTGQKESRFSHLLSGAPTISDVPPPPEPARLQVITENERIGALEETVKSLQSEIEQLRKTFAEFKKQFE
ncbi:MAG TPA: YceH family protein [Bacteroidota bacterium]|jgi:uncharacterized protein YceH (UPF0502 family)|nr:YceH family protein [Bacteroidota bacterium]